MQDGTADSSTAYTLDSHGNVTALADQQGSSSWGYDANDSVTSEARTQNGVTKTVTYGYYANGLRSSMSSYGGTISYGYDSALRLVSQTDPNDGGRAITHTYDAEGRPETTGFPSGLKERISYDIDGRIDLLTATDPAGSVLQSFDYDYGLITDPNNVSKPGPDFWNGKVTRAVESDGSATAYGYDDLGRLASAIRTGTNAYDQSYAYDANGNRTSVTTNGVTTTATYDAADQLVSLGSATYSYDRTGNLLSDGGLTYAYDSTNRTAGIETAAGARLAFGYDGQGRRVSRTIGTDRTDYWYDSTGMALETGPTTATYSRSPAGKLLSVRSGAATHNYLGDRLGSVTGLVSSAGSLTDTYGYKAYGGDNGSASTTYNPYRYTGTYLDEATGLYQMGARYYQAESASFTQADPHPTQMMGQSHAYAAGDPANNTDPTGLYVWDGSGGGGAIQECRGAFYGYRVLSVWFKRGLYGRLYWDVYLTKLARSTFGYEVLVTMPWADVNGRAIDPPYGPHLRHSSYDFHGSMDTFGWRWASGGGRIRTGDYLTLQWNVSGITGQQGGRYVFCRVPRPGVG